MADNLNLGRDWDKTFPLSPAAVSYTHLDVYKRQVDLLPAENIVFQRHIPTSMHWRCRFRKATHGSPACFRIRCLLYTSRCV